MAELLGNPVPNHPYWVWSWCAKCDCRRGHIVIDDGDRASRPPDISGNFAADMTYKPWICGPCRMGFCYVDYRLRLPPPERIDWMVRRVRQYLNTDGPWTTQPPRPTTPASAAGSTTGTVRRALAGLARALRRLFHVT